MAGRWRRMLVTGVSGAAITVSIVTWGSGAAAGDTRELTFWQATGKKPDSIFHFKAPTIVVGTEIPSAAAGPPIVSVASDQPPLPKAAPRSRVERQVLPEPARSSDVRTGGKEGPPQLTLGQNASPPVTTIAREDELPPPQQPQPGEFIVTDTAGPVGEGIQQEPMAQDTTQAPPEDKSAGLAQASDSNVAEDRASSKRIVPEIIEDNSTGLPIQTTASIAFCFLVAGILIGGGSVWKYGAKLLPPSADPAREDDTSLDLIRTKTLALPPWMTEISAAIARQYDPSAIPAWMTSSNFRASLVAASRRAA